MNVDFTIPKRNGGKWLYTLMPSLPPEKIAERNSEWYASDAIQFQDALLIESEDSYMMIRDPAMEYFCMDSVDAAEKYIDIFYNSTDIEDRKDAYCICSLLMREVFYMNGEIHDKLKKIDEDKTLFP